MWRPDWLRLAGAPSLLLRLGQRQVELWRVEANCLHFVHAERTEAWRGSSHDGLGELTKTVLSRASGPVRLTVLIDTQWMPVSLIETGPKPLIKHQALALSRHRFTTLYGQRSAEFECLCDYLPGEANTLAVACPRALITSVRQEITSAAPNIKVASVQSTLAWCLNEQAIRSAKPSCLVLQEQDRAIVAFLNDKRLVGLHPCLARLDGPSAVRTQVRQAGFLCGINAQDWAIHVVDFEPGAKPQANDVDGVKWRSLSTSEVRP